MREVLGLEEQSVLLESLGRTISGRAPASRALPWTPCLRGLLPLVPTGLAAACHPPHLLLDCLVP